MWSEIDAYLDSDQLVPEKGILKADHIRDYTLEIWFEENHDVSIYQLDMKPLLESADAGQALAPLLDPNRFRQVVGHYRLLWNDPETGDYNENSVDIAPEAVRYLCEKFGQLIEKPHGYPT
jgi:hypothetical protein